MKEYEKHVIWLDYFNSELKRKDGRRIPLSTSVRSPSLEELLEACRKLGLQPAAQAAAHPRRPRAPSGYVTVRKGRQKQNLILEIAKELTAVRGREHAAGRR